MVKRKRRHAPSRPQDTPSAPNSTAGGNSSTGLPILNKPLPWNYFFMLAIVVAGYMVYLNNLNNPFVFDDTGNIQALHEAFQLDNWYPWDLITRTRRALVIFTLAVNYSISGQAEWSYHLFNNMVHVLAGAAMFGVIRRTLLLPVFEDKFKHSASLFGLIIALIWVVHPLNTQAVTYIIQRSESLMGLFYLLTMYAGIRLLENPKQYHWYVIGFLCALLGMMSKEVMATVPFMLMVYDRIFTRWTLKEQIAKRFVLYAVIAATWLWFPAAGVEALIGSQDKASAGFGYEGLTPWQYLMTQPVVLLQYIKLALVPSPLSIDYLHKAVHTLFDIKPTPWLEVVRLIILPWIIVVGMIGATVYGLIKRHPLAILGAWYFGILSVTSSILPIADLMVEHRTYLSNAAVIALLVFAVHRVLLRRAVTATHVTFAALIVSTLLILYSALTVQRNAEYVSEISLWQSTTIARPNNPRAWHNLGSAFEQVARETTNPKEKEEYENTALACWTKVLDLTPNFDEAFNNIGQIYLRRGQLSDAEQLLLRAIEIEPDDPQYQYNLGEVFLAQKRYDLAERRYRKAIEMDPTYGKAYNNLGFALLNQGQSDAATKAFEKAIDVDPLNPEAYGNFGKVLADLGQFDEAIPYLRRSVELDPENPGRHLLLAFTLIRAGQFSQGKQSCIAASDQFPNDSFVQEQTAMMLATHPSAEVRDGERALKNARRALALTTGGIPFAMKAEAAALAELGQFDAAVKRIEGLIGVLKKMNAPQNYLDPLLEHAEVYREKKPLRADPNEKE